MTTAPVTTSIPEQRRKAVSAGQFSFDELATIYNDARVDYIVPMPMNARRMEEYVRAYDVDLTASYVIHDDSDKIGGLGMLGVRQQRVWITRVGIIPASRGQKLGQFVMEKLLSCAQERGARRAQLEVIEGNEPAYRLFLKLGFEQTGKLLVIRRPPSPPPALSTEVTVTALDIDGIEACLRARTGQTSWLTETPSLLNAGSLEGMRLTFPDGASGWIVFRNSLFQLTHVVLDAPDSTVASALLQALHSYYPRHDTKVENLPADSPLWHVFQKWGYCEAFTRVEMIRSL